MKFDIRKYNKLLGDGLNDTCDQLDYLRPKLDPIGDLSRYKNLIEPEHKAPPKRMSTTSLHQKPKPPKVKEKHRRITMAASSMINVHAASEPTFARTTPNLSKTGFCLGVLK